MPIFAQLIGTIAMGFANLFVRWFSFGLSMRLAVYSTWMITTTTFLAAVYICINALHDQLGTYAVGGGPAEAWVRFFFVGLGVLIPANAGAVLACVSSVWVGTGLYRIKKQAMFLMAGGPFLK